MRYCNYEDSPQKGEMYEVTLGLVLMLGLGSQIVANSVCELASKYGQEFISYYMLGQFLCGVIIGPCRLICMMALSGSEGIDGRYSYLISQCFYVLIILMTTLSFYVLSGWKRDFMEMEAERLINQASLR